VTLPDPDAWPVADSLDGDEDLLTQRAAATPQVPAVVDADRDEQWTYARMDERATATARWLCERVTSAGRVGLLLDAGMAFVDSYFATARWGVPAVPLNVRLDGDALAAQVERADLTAVVAGASTCETARSITPEAVPVLAAEDRPTGPDCGRQREGGSTSEPSVSRQSTAERLVLFTSGTTGRPKGVRLTRENLVASAVGSADRLGVEAGDRWLAPLPPYHMGGLAPLIRSTLHGTTTVLQREFDPGATAVAVDDRGVTALSLVPTALGRLLDDGWRPPESLRFVLLGGGPASRDLVERATARGVPVAPTYGLTETASQVATATPAEARDHPESVGRPLRTVEAAVVDDGICDPGETGEVVVDGPTVTPGYLDPGLTAGAFDDRGLRTGDLASRDDDGRLRIAGRVDDRIVTGGENVDPGRVAEALCALESVEDAAVVGLPDDEWGERVAALVVGPPSLTAAAVRDGVRESLADFEVPKTVVVVDALPRTPSGTVDRGAVRDHLEPG